MIYEGIKEVLSGILANGMDLGVITNLNVELDDELRELLGRAVFVRVSLDAADPDTYSRLHRPIDGGDFQRVLGNIRAIRNGHVDIGINYLVQVENYLHIERAAELAAELRATYIRFTPAHTIHAGREYLPLWDEIVSQFTAARRYDADGLTVLGAANRFKNMVENNKDYPRCIYHEFHPILGADLNLYPCCVLNYFQGYEMASLKRRAFKGAWDSVRRKRFSLKLEPRYCPPCWFDEQNRLMNYLVLQEKRHANFL